MTERYSLDDSDVLERVTQALAAGKLVVLPTDTVYGLAALPSVPGATDAVFAAKGRPVDVPLAVLVDSLGQASGLVAQPAQAVERLVERWWPGPLTVVLRRRPEATVSLGGDERSVGVRCPDHALVRAVARQLGPIAVTSANRHAAPTPATADEVVAALGGAVALVVDGGPLAGIPSTVVDGTGEEVRILRAGSITEEEIAGSALP